MIVEKELEHQFVSKLERHQNIAHKICRLYTHDRESHNDLFQEITIQLWKAYPKFRGEAKFSTWMYRVALNTAITLYRKKKRGIRTQDFDTVHFKIKAEEYDDETEQQLGLMYNAIKELNDIEKALVFLYLEDKNYKEISHCFPLNPSDGLINWSQSSTQILRQINAHNKPYTGAFSSINKEKVIIWDAELVDIDHVYHAVPGQIIKIDEGYIQVACGEGQIKISSIEIDNSLITPDKYIKSIRTRFK